MRCEKLLSSVILYFDTLSAADSKHIRAQWAARLSPFPNADLAQSPVKTKSTPGYPVVTTESS